MKKNAYAHLTGGQGIGIDALFAEPENQFSLIYLDQIEVKAQLRESFEDDENTLADLAESIKVRGLLQPILLRPKGSSYELVAGERRFRACQLAKLEQVPAYIREMTDEEAEDAQLAENIHRKNLTQIEEAKKIQRDLDRLGNIEAVLEKHQKSRSWLSKILSLLSLPEQAKRLVTENVSADLEVINTVKSIEKVDPSAAKDLVDELKETRGKVNARDKVSAVKEQVKPSKKQDKPKGKPTDQPDTDETPIFAPAKKEEEDPSSVVGQTDDNTQPIGDQGAENAKDELTPTESLRKAYANIYEMGMAPQEIELAMSAEERRSTEAWLNSFYEIGLQAKDVGRGVIQGFRNGQFSSEGEGAFALLAFLNGTDSGAKFNFRDILGGVKK